MILYHGSDHEVGQPIFGAGKPNNDYGKGFYCTMEHDMACEWACPGADSGFVNKYELNLTGLKVMQLHTSEYHILNWFAILLENRTFDTGRTIPRQNKEYILSEFLPDYKDADVIIGYRADDSYFAFAKDFLNNAISLQDLSRAMKLGKLGLQVVLVSEKAFSQISFLGCEHADAAVFYPKRMARDSFAREEFRRMSDAGPSSDAILAYDIVRNKWKNGDERLR